MLKAQAELLIWKKHIFLNYINICIIPYFLNRELACGQLDREETPPS